MYPSKPDLISSGVASLKLFEANLGQSGRISATHIRPSGWYMIHPRGSGPKGELTSSPSDCSTFHDTSLHVPCNCSLTECEAGRFGAKRGCGRTMMWSDAAAVVADMGHLISDFGRSGQTWLRDGAPAHRQARLNRLHPTHPTPRAWNWTSPSRSDRWRSPRVRRPARSSRICGQRHQGD